MVRFQLKSVLLFQCLQHRLMYCLGDQVADPAMAAAVGDPGAVAAGHHNHAVGACTGSLHPFGVAAGYPQILQCCCFCLGDGDHSPGQSPIRQPGIGQHHDVDGSGGRISRFNVGPLINPGAQGVAFGSGSDQGSHGKGGKLSGHNGQVVHIRSRADQGQVCRLQPQFACDHRFALLLIDLATALQPGGKIFGQLHPELWVGSMINRPQAVDDAIAGEEQVSPLIQLYNQTFFPEAVPFGLQYLCSYAKLRRQGQVGCKQRCYQGQAD